MFNHRSPEQPYTQQQTMQWLNWLASNRFQHQQTIFSIEGLEPYWLQSRFQLWLYRLCIRLNVWLLGWLMVGMIGMLDGWLVFEWVVFECGNTASAGLFGSKKLGKNDLGLVFALGCVLWCVLIGVLGHVLIGGLVVYLFFVIIGGLISATDGLIGGGLAGIQHLVLRTILWRYDHAPLNYTRFLD